MPNTGLKNKVVHTEQGARILTDAQDTVPTECNEPGVLILKTSASWLDECNVGQGRQSKINTSLNLIQVGTDNKP